MRKELVISTRNEKKFKEIERLFEDLKIKILFLRDFSDMPDVVEDGETFEDNAVKKALTISRLVDKPVLADDSGLEVKTLDNKPGVYSSRYAGPEKDDRKNCVKLLKALKGKDKDERQARFRCVIAIAEKGKVLNTIEGVCKGHIGTKAEGETGFGYDPLFIPEGYDKTFAQLGPEAKDRLSHRGKALKEAKKFILSLS